MREILATFDAAGPGGRLFALEIAEATRLGSRVMYSLLARLERTGWLSSGWDDPNEAIGTRRRFYYLTSLGQDRIGYFLNPRVPMPTEPSHQAPPVSVPRTS